MFNFCVDNKNVAFRIDKDITGNDIPNQVISVGVAPLVILLHKAEGCHVCVNHNLSGGYGVGYANLTENRLYGTTVKASKAMKPVGSIGKKHIMHHNLFEQCYNTAAVHQVVYFIDRIIGYIGIVLIAAGTRNTKVKYLCHRNPKTFGLRHLFGHALLSLKRSYICLASSRLRFM